MHITFASPSSPPPFVNRVRELATLRAELAAAFAGQGRLVLLSGEAGIGKTALAAMLCREAADTGAHVLLAHCYDRIESPPYGPWLEFARRVGALPSPANTLPIPRLDTAASQADLFAQVRDFLTDLTAQRPLLLVLEDLHWIDSASLDLLRFIARGIGDMPLLLMATYRDEEVDRRHPLSSLVPLLVREAPTERLDLRPLDAAAARALVRARHAVPDAQAARLAAYLISRTEGNALYLTELLRSLAEEGQLDRTSGGAYTEIVAPVPVPLLLKQIVDGRLARLGDETAALLAVAAVVGQEVPLAVWQAVTSVDEEALLTAAERGQNAHLVMGSARGDGIRFSHALIRDVLYENVPALRRRRIHRRVAEVLIALPTPDPDTVAYHYLQAGDERAAGWLVRAGERAEDAYALVTAAERYEAAFLLLDTQDRDAAERGWLRLLAAALRRHEDLDQAFAWTEEAVRLAATAGDPSLVARAQALLGNLIGIRGDHRTSIEIATVGLDMIDQLPPGVGVARRREQQIDKIINRGTMIAGLAYGGRLTEARTEGESWLARSADTASTPGGLSAIADAQHGLAVTYALQGEPERARRSYAAAVAAYRASDTRVFALVSQREELILVVLPYQADDLAERERAVAAAERMAAWVVARGGHENPNLPRYAHLPLHILDGRWREARAILAEPDPTDLVMLTRVLPLYRGMLARAQGDALMAWRCVHEPAARNQPWHSNAEPDEHLGFRYQPQFQLLAAGLALDAGDRDAARSWLDLHRRWLDFMDATLGRSEEAVLEAQWHRAAGDVAQARHHARQALAHATAPRQPLALLAAHRMLGILASDGGDREAAEEHFAQALTLADACRAPYERALTLIAHAEFAVAQGDLPTATSLLDEARALCLPLDALPALARIERLAAPIGGTAERAPAGLTAREVEVLRLVAAGHANAAISERLFLSPRTVKAHVANIFAKIGVHDRAAAAAFARRHGIA